VRGRRVYAISRRHAYVLMRSPHRWFDVFIWPVVDVLLWGSLGVFVSNQSPEADRAGVTYLLAGILLFHVLYQSQIAASTEPCSRTSTWDGRPSPPARAISATTASAYVSCGMPARVSTAKSQ